MAGVDFGTCEQPDELIQIAWNAGLERKRVISEGTDAAMLLLAGERNELTTLFWPVPRPLEAVCRWSDNPRPVAGVVEGLRPFASAVVPGCILGAIVTHFFVAPHLSASNGQTAMIAIIVATIAVLGVVLKVLIDAAVRRRAAALDEETALAIVLEQLRLGMIVNAALVPRACVWIRRALGQRPSSRPSSG